MIPFRVEFEGPKDGSNFQQWLFACWGRDGHIGSIVMTGFINLAQQYGWSEVYEGFEFAAKMNKKNFRYCEVSCEKRAKQRKEQEQAKKNKPMIQCRECNAIYPINGHHECEDVLPVFKERTPTTLPLPGPLLQGEGGVDDNPDKVKEIVAGIKQEWNEKEQKTKTVKEIVAETMEMIRNTPDPERVKPSELVKKNYPVFEKQLK